MGIHYLMHAWNKAFDGLGYIENKQQHVSLSILDKVNTLKLLHAIYAHSDILHCLKFLLTNDTCKPFTIFIDDNFLSKSTAYRTRKVCLAYLHMIGLDVKKNCSWHFLKAIMIISLPPIAAQTAVFTRTSGQQQILTLFIKLFLIIRYF